VEMGVRFCAAKRGVGRLNLKPNWDESVDRFDDMGLKEEVLRGIYGYGFNKPSPIQQKGILPVIQGHDTIA
jgi:translation initiation factor 4A